MQWANMHEIPFTFVVSFVEDEIFWKYDIRNRVWTKIVIAGGAPFLPIITTIMTTIITTTATATATYVLPCSY